MTENQSLGVGCANRIGMKTMNTFMDDGARKWLYKTAHKSHWRVASWYDLEDLIQEGYICYYKVRARYPDAVDRPHIMRLFQRTFTNRIHDLAKHRTRMQECAFTDLVPQLASTNRLWEELLPSDDETASLYTMITQSKDEVKALLQALATEAGRKSMRAVYRVRLGSRRETFNERLCRLTGYDPKTTDIITAVRAHFAV